MLWQLPLIDAFWERIVSLSDSLVSDTTRVLALSAKKSSV